jgi:hypothetical protein
MGIMINATFYESWLRTIGSLPMRLMGVAILEFRALGEDELANDLLRVRDSWARLVAKRAKVAVESERLQHIGQVIEASLLGDPRERPVLRYRDARRQLPAECEVRDAG